MITVVSYKDESWSSKVEKKKASITINDNEYENSNFWGEYGLRICTKPQSGASVNVSKRITINGRENISPMTVITRATMANQSTINICSTKDTE